MGIRIEGMKELDRALQKLKAGTARNVVKRGLEAALQPVASAAKANAPRTNRTGDGYVHLADTIVVSAKLNEQESKFAHRLPRTVTQMYVGADSPHAHLIEFGTGPRHHKSGRFVGSVSPEPFMRPAWEANKDAVLASLVASVRAELEKTIARAAKAAAKKAARGQ